METRSRARGFVLGMLADCRGRIAGPTPEPRGPAWPCRGRAWVGVIGPAGRSAANGSGGGRAGVWVPETPGSHRRARRPPGARSTSWRGSGSEDSPARLGEHCPSRGRPDRGDQSSAAEPGTGKLISATDAVDNQRMPTVARHRGPAVGDRAQDRAVPIAHQDRDPGRPSRRGSGACRVPLSQDRLRAAWARSLSGRALTSMPILGASIQHPSRPITR